MSDDEKLKGIAPIELGEKTVQQVQLVMAIRDMRDLEFVNEHWDLVHCCDGSYRSYPRGTVIVQDVHGHWLHFATWSHAAEYTRERLEQIRQVQEEIRMIELQISCRPSIENGEASHWSAEDIRRSTINVHRWSRILAARQTALDELRRGMK